MVSSSSFVFIVIIIKYIWKKLPFLDVHIHWNNKSFNQNEKNNLNLELVSSRKPLCFYIQGTSVIGLTLVIYRCT